MAVHRYLRVLLAIGCLLVSVIFFVYSPSLLLSSSTEQLEFVEKVNYAFATLISKDSTEYNIMACALGTSLKIYSPNTDRVALLVPEISETTSKVLEFCFWKIVRVPHIVPNFYKTCNPTQWGNLFAKVWFWNLTDYERVVHVDADGIILGDPSALLKLPELTACNLAGDGGLLQDKFRRVFNGGFFILKPSQITMKRIMSFENSVPEVHTNGEKSGFDCTEMGLVNVAFRDWKLPPPSLEKLICFDPWQFTQRHDTYAQPADLINNLIFLHAFKINTLHAHNMSWFANPQVRQLYRFMWYIFQSVAAKIQLRFPNAGYQIPGAPKF
jgi:hypothetical protein